MRLDLIFTTIALPFCIGFGMFMCCPLESGLIFVTMLILREAAPPSG